jgi:hypothetical protein
MMRSTVSARSLMLLPGTISAVRWWLRFTYSRLADLCSSGPIDAFRLRRCAPSAGHRPTHPALLGSGSYSDAM